jgi:hypothetical protein
MYPSVPLSYVVELCAIGRSQMLLKFCVLRLKTKVLVQPIQSKDSGYVDDDRGRNTSDIIRLLY